MKKLLFGLIATVMFGFVGSAQNSNKVKLFCVTASCCGIGPFGIEIWSQTTCYYGSNRATIKFNAPTDLKEVTVSEDVILSLKNNIGENLILAKGTYPVVNDGIEFTPQVQQKASTYCIENHTEGQLFGHEYSFTIKVCVTFGRANNNGLVTIVPKLSDDDLRRLLTENKGEISFNHDIEIKSEELNFKITAGTYALNEDGSIYIENVKVK